MKILKSENFEFRVKEIKLEKNCTLLEALVSAADEYSIDNSQVKKLMGEEMVSLLEEEAYKSKMLKKSV